MQKWTISSLMVKFAFLGHIEASVLNNQSKVPYSTGFGLQFPLCHHATVINGHA